MNEKETPFSHALKNLNRKIADKVNRDAFTLIGHEDCLEKQFNDLVEAFLASHKIPYDRHLNIEHSDEIAVSVRQICQKLADRVVQTETQRLFESLGEQILKEHF